MLIGLDFGTCYSSAALTINNSSKPIKEPISRGYSFPSSVFITAQEQILIGQAAENSRQKDPQRYRREFKRDLGSPNPYTVGSSAWLPEELITEVILKLKTEAEKVARGLGEARVTNAILTIPATYQPFKRQLMKQAGIKAGFDQIKLLEEPVAAAYYYSRQTQIEAGDIVLVYDLGGGTFDATLIQKQHSGYQILGMPRGLSHCGGTDFDRQIYQGLKDRCSPQLREQLESRDAWLARAIVTESCRDLKHQLSEQPEATIYIPMGLTSVESYSLSRLEFNQTIAPLIAETIECCDQLVRSAGIKWQQVDRVLLVGGSCRIPYIKTAVEQKLKRSALLIDEPELAVCIGAAIDGLETNKTQVPVTSPVKPLDPPQPPPAPVEIKSPRLQAQDLYQQALKQSQDRDYSQAIALLSQALQLNPDYPEVLETRATIRHSIGDRHGAIADLQQAAQIFFARQDFTQYRQAFEKIEGIYRASAKRERTEATRKQPNSEWSFQQNTNSPIREVTPPPNKPKPANTHLARALTALFAQNYQQAIEASTREIELNRDCADAYVCRGLARFIEQNYHGATQDFYQAVRQDPEHGGAYLGRSILRAFLGDHRRAIADCQKLAQIDSNFNRVEHNKNLAAAAQKQPAQVVNYLLQTTPRFLEKFDNTSP